MNAALDAAIAGLIAGVAELALVLARGDAALAGSTVIVVGLTVLAVTLVGTPAIVLLRLLGRHPLGAPLAARLRVPGAPRVEALATLAIAAIAVAMIWGIGYRLIAYAHRHYRAAVGAGLLASTELIVVTLVVAIGATAIGPRLVRWLGGRAALHRATTGRAGLGLGIGLALVVAATIHAALPRVAPEFDAPPAYVLALAALAVIVAAAVAPARRLPRSARLGVAAACGALALAGLAMVGRVDRARGAVIAHGSISRIALRTLHAITDGDDDGFSDAFGGGDCDDHDARVHPGADEIAGNGADDNCAGGDADASAMTHRLVVNPSTTPGAPRRDILLVTIDTVRADHTSAYGYARDTTPRLAALAATGAKFLRAESPAPLTRWAIPALLFGRYASTLPYPTRGGRQLGKHKLPSLASALRDAGYATHAIVPYDNLFGVNSLTGFAQVEEVSAEGRVLEHTDNAVDVADRALAWIAVQPADRPCFLWVHFIDPHPPYVPPDAAPRFGDDDAYDRELAWADAQLGRLVDGARAARGADVIVAITSDHGEAFGDHGVRYHAKNLYEDQTHVPLVILAPGAAPQQIAAPVSLVDIAPTLLDLVGVAAPVGMNGWSVAAAVRGAGPVPEHDVLGELFRGPSAPRNLLSLHRGDDVVIRDLDVTTLEQYDLATDPDQRHPRAADLAAALDDATDRELGIVPDLEEP